MAERKIFYRGLISRLTRLEELAWMVAVVLGALAVLEVEEKEFAVVA